MNSRPTTAKTSSPRRYRGLVLLLVCLAGLVGWGAFLAIDAPYHDRDIGLSSHVLPEHSVALMQQLRESDSMKAVVTWSKTVAFDLETSVVWPPHHARFAVLMDFGDDGEAHWLAETGNVEIWDLNHPDDVRWIVTDLKTGRVLKSVPYQLEIGSNRTLCQKRFIVTKQENAIEVIDLNAASPTPKSYPTSNPNRSIELVSDSGAFVVYQKTGSPTQSFELFHLNDDGEVRAVTSWSATPLGQAAYAWPGFSGGEVATIGVNADNIEIRNTEDGSVARTVLLPADFDPRKMTCGFSEDLLMYLDNKTLKILDWRNNVLLPSIVDSDKYWRHDGSLVVVRSVSGHGRRVIDVRTGETIGRFHSMHGLDFFDRERAFVSGSNHGWTITEFDLATGKIVRQWQPFGYVGPSLIGWLVALLAWCVAWMLISARQESWAWVDVLLIGGVPFGLLTFRAVVAGDTLNAERHVYQYAQGIAMAGATVALLWLVFGRTRITLRVLPLIAFSAVVAAVLASVFRRQPTTAWYALGSTFVPVVVLSVWLLMLRLLKWRIVNGDEDTGTREPTRYPIRDLFWITLVMSAGFAVLQFIISEADALLDLKPVSWPLLISQIVGMVAIVGALSRHRRAFVPCVVIVVAAVVYLVVEPVARYASDRLYDIYPLLPTNVPHRILTTFPVAVFALLLPYRMRGWRLGTKHDVQASLLRKGTHSSCSVQP